MLAKSESITHYMSEPALKIDGVGNLPRAPGLKVPLSFKNRGL